MNRFAVLTLALLGMLQPLAASALDEPTPAPTPSTTFSDPAMSFTPPSGFYRIPVPPHDPAQFEDKALVAAYIKNPRTSNAISLTISMQNFDGNAKAFATSADNDLREGGDVFIKQTATKLSNGMPAIFEEITNGSGFAQMQEYRYLWGDGVRGVEVSEVARYGMLDSKKAMADMAQLSAVAYPKYRY